jgi:hypothetical protein
MKNYKAVREENVVGIRADRDSETLTFDVPDPLLSRGARCLCGYLGKGLSWSEKPVAFRFHDVNVTAGKDVAFATAIGRCAARCDVNSVEPFPESLRVFVTYTDWQRTPLSGA